MQKLTDLHPGTNFNTVSACASYINMTRPFSVKTMIENIYNTVSPPPSGLGSNSNYILYSGCGPMIDVGVTIDITGDIVCKSVSGGSTTGFGFQLNAYSPKNNKCAWQQYCIAIFDNQIHGWIDNWPVSGDNLINNCFTLASAPNNMIPAGYKLKIMLQNDTTGNVTGCVYVVVDNNGKTLASVSKTLTDLPNVTSNEIAPITAFELNLVGPENSESVVLSSGAGTILYSSSNIITVLNQEPSCTESGYITAETANSFYGILPSAPGKNFIQSFWVSIEAPTIHKHGKPRPSLVFCNR